MSLKKETSLKETENEEERGDGDEHKFTLLILIYNIYIEEFITNLIRSEALMPFL